MRRSVTEAVTGFCILAFATASWAQTPGHRAAGRRRVRRQGSAEPRSNAQTTSTDALARQVQSLEERLAAMNAELERLRHQAATRPELLGRLDRLEALARKLREDLDALRIRQADVERDRAQVTEALEKHKSGSWRFGYKGGFQMQSPADHFSLKVKGFIVGRYTLGAVQTSDATADPEDGVDENSFELVHAKFKFMGHVWTPKLSYAFEVETAKSPKVKKAFFKIQPWSFWSVTIGQHKVMDSRDILSSTARLQLVDRSRAVKNFAHGYDVGVSTTVSFWKQAFLAQFGIFNGSGENVPNDDKRLLYVLRLGTAPLGPVPNIEEDAEISAHPKLWLGTSAEFNRVDVGDLDGDGKMDEKQVYTLGAEAAFYWKGFNFESEFFAAIGHHTVKDCPTSYPVTNRECNKIDTSYGAYAQVGYILGRGFQLAGRFSYTEVYDNGWSGDLTTGTWKRTLKPIMKGPKGYRLDHLYEATAGLLYDPWSYHLRLGLIYSYQRESFLSDESSVGPTTMDRNVHLASLVARVNF